MFSSSSIQRFWSVWWGWCTHGVAAGVFLCKLLARVYFGPPTAPSIGPGSNPPAIAQRCSRLWRRLFNDAYEAQPLHQRASEVAGSWKALYAEKTQTMAAANGWTRPSPSELAALLTCLSEQASTAALVSAAPAAAGCGASEPPSPRGPLSPAFSGASSASSLPMSPLRLDSLASQSSAMSISPRSSLNGSGPALVGASPESLSWHVPLHGSPPSAAATTFGGSPPGLGLMAAAAGGPGSRAKQPMQQQQPQQRAPQEAHVVYLLDGSGSVPGGWVGGWWHCHDVDVA